MIYCCKYLLKNIVSIHAGYSIRSKIPENPDGKLKIIQMKDINPDMGIDWKCISRINPISSRIPSCLSLNDIIFSGRGTKIFAVTMDKNIEKVLAAPQFFVIKPDNSKVVSSYLSWYINQKKAQIYFKRNVGSSLIVNVTRKTLEELPVLLPSIHDQNKIVGYYKSIKKELMLAKKLYQKKTQFISAIISQNNQEEK